MTPAEIVAKVREAGGHILLAEGKLAARKVPASLVPLLREHKAEIVAYLAQETVRDSESYRSPTPAPESPQMPQMAQQPALPHRCEDCGNYQPDHVNPEGGMGRCKTTANGLPPKGNKGYGAPFPKAPRNCPSYQEKEIEQ